MTMTMATRGAENNNHATSRHITLSCLPIGTYRQSMMVTEVAAEEEAADLAQYLGLLVEVRHAVLES
jgi:hypothetical protein